MVRKLEIVTECATMYMFECTAVFVSLFIKRVFL
jgi:hypothetical protein